MRKKMKKNESPKRKITGKELSSLDEFSIRLDILVELLDNKGILNKKEYERISTMRLHEISKARAFEDLDEEL
ncbi:MAG: hypothetical protein E6L03_00270 [Thaumarchaeota archaeon]|jgi:hypothetical protein|nr:MAG: hypothetical protein E6L03_00270 [Nitrososphaerota archaeon]